MRQKPVDLNEMLRLALAAHVDLGLTEIVLNKKAALMTVLPFNLATPHKKVVPVVDALNSQAGISGTDQTSLLSVESQYNSPVYGSIDQHHKAICDCLKCPLGQTRNKFVYGVGSPDANLLFIGEAPGVDEDRLGEPFVGRAGQLLDKILAAIQLSRKEVYIANILKCRPPGNRDPQPDEMSECLPYLKEQIRLIKPKLICLLGRVAAQAILQTKTPLGKMRSRWHQFEGIPTLVTDHPAALLRFQAYKKDTWADMQMLKARYDELI